MGETRVTTTQRAQLNALAYQGILPSDCYAQIKETLGKLCGEETARIFAEPVANTEAGFIDWYVPWEGRVQKIVELSSEEREQATTALQKHARIIQKTAEELIASQDLQKVTRGHLLELVLLYPSSNDLYLVGERAVVTCWSFAPGTTEAEGEHLAALKLPIARPKEERPPVSKQFLWFLLPLALLLLLIYALFADFGDNKSLLGTPLFQGPNLFQSSLCAENARLSSEIKALMQKQDQLLQELLAKAKLCVPKPKEPKPIPLPSKPKKILDLPSNVQDMHFLQGRWVCETGLVNSRTRQPVQVEFMFDAEGNGTGLVIEPTQRCQGKAHAKMQKTKLFISHEPLGCDKGDEAYAGNTIECARDTAGVTQCRGRNVEGEPWQALFYQKEE